MGLLIIIIIAAVIYKFFTTPVPSAEGINNQATTTMPDLSKIVFVDVETTGLDPNKDEILQVSLVSGLGEVLFSEYIQPMEHKRWTEATKYNGITPKMVKNQGYISEYKRTIQSIIDNADVLVGYNIEFDLSFLKAAGIKRRFKVTKDMMHEFSLYMKEKNKNSSYEKYSLQECAWRVNYKYDDKHSKSVNDCLATLKCYNKLSKI